MYMTADLSSSICKMPFFTNNNLLSQIFRESHDFAGVSCWNPAAFVMENLYMDL